MKSTILYTTAAMLTFGSQLGLAKELDREQALQLQQAGTIMPAQQLEDIALKQHPGATVREGELEKTRKGYVYEVDLRDEQGKRWELKLDASNGELLENRQDD